MALQPHTKQKGRSDGKEDAPLAETHATLQPKILIFVKAVQFCMNMASPLVLKRAHHSIVILTELNIVTVGDTMWTIGDAPTEHV